MPLLYGTIIICAFKDLTLTETIPDERLMFFCPQVGFCSIALIDDGLTFLIRASRVKSGFRGQGVYGRLLKHIYAEYKDVDSIKYDAMTTDNYNCEDKKSLETPYAVMCRKVCNYLISVAHINLDI